MLSAVHTCRRAHLGGYEVAEGNALSGPKGHSAIRCNGHVIKRHDHIVAPQCWGCMAGRVHASYKHACSGWVMGGLAMVGWMQQAQRDRQRTRWASLLHWGVPQKDTFPNLCTLMAPIRLRVSRITCGSTGPQPGTRQPPTPTHLFAGGSCQMRASAHHSPAAANGCLAQGSPWSRRCAGSRWGSAGSLGWGSRSPRSPRSHPPAPARHAQWAVSCVLQLASVDHAAPEGVCSRRWADVSVLAAPPRSSCRSSARMCTHKHGKATVHTDWQEAR